MAFLTGATFLGTGTIAACDSAAPPSTKKTNVLDPQTYPTPDEGGVPSTDNDQTVTTSLVKVNKKLTNKQKKSG